MKQVEVFNFRVPPPPGSSPRKKPHLTRWKMTKAEAAERFPGSWPDEVTREVRTLPDTEEELRHAMFRMMPSGKTTQRD